MAKPLSILVIDDHVVARRAIVEVLRADLRCPVVAVSSDLDEVVRTVREMQPTAILVDCRLKDGETAHLARALHQTLPGARIVVTGLTEHTHVAQFVAAGVRGFILKDAVPNAYIAIVRTVAEGGHTLPRRLTSTLFHEIVLDGLRAAKGTEPNVANLSRREKQVIELVGDDLSNKEIAARLSVSVHTIKSHMRHLLEKLQLRNRRHIAAFVRSGVETRER